MGNLIITPKTKVGELLEVYPELEDVLIEIAPVFSKLKNPVLRKTIAKITSLEQAASIAELRVDKIVNRLRGIVGQDELLSEEHSVSTSSKEGKPAWLNESRIITTNDARTAIALGEHPLGEVIGAVSKFSQGDIYVLITPFLPAPLLDKVRDLGCEVWTEKVSAEQFNNYFCKS